MALTSYIQRTGSQFRIYSEVKEGWKSVPFDPKNLVNTAYLVTRWSWLGSTNLADKTCGYNVGAPFPGEILPSHATRTSIYTPGVSIESHGMQAYVRAYEKFRSKVYLRADSLTAIVERGKTFEMVANRLKQLARGALALRKGRFREFCRTFNITPKAKHLRNKWTRPKDFSALWLEYWMGWAPTVGDVYNSLGSLGQILPPDTIRAGSSTPYTGGALKKDVNGYAGYTISTSFDGQVRVTIQADVAVTNPFLFTCEGLGIMNPATTLWNVTGFSWFVDWFTNIGQCLSQLTDFVGLQLKNLQVSIKTTALCSCEIWGANHPFVYGGTLPYYVQRDQEFTAFSRHQMPAGNLPLIKPFFRIPNGLSLSRGATAVSLLIALFTPGPAPKIRAKL